jgi:putative aldouronate transport system substrate-binding protein
MLKKTFIILLVLSMIAAFFAGCKTGESVDLTEATGTSKPAAKTAEPVQRVGNDEEDEPNDLTIELPLVADKVTFAMWGPSPRADSGMNDMNDSIARQELERMTNVHIEWVHPAVGQESAQFNLMLASLNWPDACIGISGYLVGGWDKYIDDGFVLDLTPYTKYMKNYLSRRNVDDPMFNDQTLRNTMTDKNKICFFQDIRKTIQPSWIGPGIRRDVLEQMNMEIPVTFEDWENVMKALQEQMNIKNPLMITAASGIDRFILSSFDVFHQIYQIDGKVKYPAYEPAFKDFVVLMHDWYDKGYIDDEFFNKNSWSDNESDLLNGESMMTTSLAYINIDRYDQWTEGDTADWYPIEVPKKTPDATRKIYSWAAPSYACNYTTNLTTAIEEDKIPILLKYFDYLFTDEGSDLANYGILGETYEIDENGKPYFKDFIYNNPEGMSFSACMTKYALFYSLSCWYDWEREITPTMSEKAWPITGQVWDKSIKDPQIMPSSSILSIPEDDLAEYTRIYNDLQTFVEEMVSKFIVGQIPLENYDEFIAELEHLGVNDLIAMHQEAYDKYMLRDISVGYSK